MATVRPAKKRTKIEFCINTRRKSVHVDIKPNKEGLRAAKQQAQEAEYRLLGGDSWATVRAWLRGEEDQVDDPLAEVGTVGHYADLYFETHEIAASTMGGYKNLYYRWWYQKLHRRDPREVLRTECQMHLKRNATNVSTKTRKGAVSVLKMILDLAASELNFPNPLHGWTIKRGMKSPPDPYETEERDLLLSTMKSIANEWTKKKKNSQPEIEADTAYRFIKLGFDTGMRTGELLGLRWENVDLKKGRIRICEEVVRGIYMKKTKTDKWRTTYISDRTIADLQSSPTRFVNTFVFLNTVNTNFHNADELNAFFNQAHELSGVRRRTRSDGSPMPYPWRSTYISHALNGGMIPKTLCERTGHDLRTMLENYAGEINVDEDHERNMVNNIFG